MPFTLAHPAAVLPLLRHPFSTVALVAGAVAPDLPYFARRTPIPVTAQSWYEPFMNATTSHGLVGALTVSLPYALALCGLVCVARRPVAELVRRPAGSKDGSRGGPGDRGVVARLGWVVLSALVGVATHLVWDSFTHSDGYVVTHVPALSEPAAGALTWARALQHASTVVGLLLVAWYLWRRRAGLGPVRRRALWWGGGVVVAGAVVGTLDLWADTGLTAGETVEAALAGAATGAGAALLVALVVYLAAWWVVRWVVTA